MTSCTVLSWLVRLAAFKVQPHDVRGSGNSRRGYRAKSRRRVVDFRNSIICLWFSKGEPVVIRHIAIV